MGLFQFGVMFSFFLLILDVESVMASTSVNVP